MLDNDVWMSINSFTLVGKELFFTGNPVAPFFMNSFGGENSINWDVVRSQMQFQYYSSLGMGRSFLDFLMLPINLTFFSEAHSLKFDGRIGILYLLLIPALLGLESQIYTISHCVFRANDILVHCRHNIFAF